MPVVNSAEFATLHGLPLQTPAWTHHNLFELWSGPATRGSDVVIPGAAGARAYPREIAAWKTTLELTIFGDFDSDGNPNADRRLGLWDNVQELRGATDPLTFGPGAVILTVTAPGPLERSAWVTVERFQLGGDLGPYAVRATIDLVVLSGDFTAEPGSV